MTVPPTKFETVTAIEYGKTLAASLTGAERRHIEVLVELAESVDLENPKELIECFDRLRRCVDGASDEIRQAERELEDLARFIGAD